MTIEWNKVTWYSKIAAIVLFVGTFFLGFWLGTQRVEYAYVQVAHRESVQTTNSISVQATQTELPQGINNTYQIVSPRPGDHFQEDEPITVVWQPFDELEDIYVFLIPDNCSDKICDEIYGGDVSIDLLKSYLPPPYARFYTPNKGFLTISLPKYSPVVAYPPGKYRIVLMTPYTRNTPHQTLLVQSDPFTITIPADRTRMLGIGDKLGDFIITSKSTNGIATKGATIIRGVYYVEKMLGLDCFDVTQEDAWKIPRIGSGDRSPGFCFSNDISDELRQSVSTTTIEIKNYYVDMRQMETADGADFVRIVR